MFECLLTHCVVTRMEMYHHPAFWIISVIQKLENGPTIMPLNLTDFFLQIHLPTHLRS